MSVAAALGTVPRALSKPSQSNLSPTSSTPTTIDSRQVACSLHDLNLVWQHQTAHQAWWRAICHIGCWYWNWCSSSLPATKLLRHEYSWPHLFLCHLIVVVVARLQPGWRANYCYREGIWGNATRQPQQCLLHLAELHDWDH